VNVSQLRLRSDKFDDEDDDDDDNNNNSNNNNNNLSSVVTMLGRTFRLALDCHGGTLSLYDIYSMKFILLLLC
jgi:hypothetical protein